MNLQPWPNQAFFLRERVSLAQAPWETIEPGVPDTDEHSAASEAIRRDEELSSGSTVGRARSEVMQAAQQKVGSRN